MTEKASATWVHNEGNGETLEWWCNEDKENRDVLLRMSLPSMVSGSSDTCVRDSTTVSKQRRNELKNGQTFSSTSVSWVSAISFSRIYVIIL